MPSVLPERIKRLMEDQAEEAPLPVSYSTLRVRGEMPEPPGEFDEVTPAPSDEVPPNEQMPAPETEEPPASEMPDVAEMDVPEEQPPEDKPDPDWDDSIDDMQRQFGGDVNYEEYAPAEHGWRDEIGWQQSLADRSNSY